MSVTHRITSGVAAAAVALPIVDFDAGEAAGTGIVIDASASGGGARAATVGNLVQDGPAANAGLDVGATVTAFDHTMSRQATNCAA